jgi:hypothetical protein
MHTRPTPSVSVLTSMGSHLLCENPPPPQDDLKGMTALTEPTVPETNCHIHPFLIH